MGISSSKGLQVLVVLAWPVGSNLSQPQSSDQDPSISSQQITRLN